MAEVSEWAGGREEDGVACSGRVRVCIIFCSCVLSLICSKLTPDEEFFCSCRMSRREIFLSKS